MQRQEDGCENWTRGSGDGGRPRAHTNKGLCRPRVRSVSGRVLGRQTQADPRAGRARRKGRMQGARTAARLRPREEERAQWAQEGVLTCVLVGGKEAQRASRPRVPAYEREQRRKAFSGVGPRREATWSPLRWEPRYRVKEGPHRPERTDDSHCWCTVVQGAACRRWGSLRQLTLRRTPESRWKVTRPQASGVSSYSPRRTAVCTAGLWFPSFLASLWGSARHPAPVLLVPY